jgi:hypothetical protein
MCAVPASVRNQHRTQQVGQWSQFILTKEPGHGPGLLLLLFLLDGIATSDCSALLLSLLAAFFQVAFANLCQSHQLKLLVPSIPETEILKVLLGVIWTLQF